METSNELNECDSKAQNSNIDMKPIKRTMSPILSFSHTS